MHVKIYKNYGMLGHEKESVYTTRPAADVFDVVTVEIPDRYHHGRNKYGEILLDLNGTTYALDDVLCGGDHPCIMVPDDGETECEELHVMWFVPIPSEYDSVVTLLCQYCTDYGYGFSDLDEAMRFSESEGKDEVAVIDMTEDYCDGIWHYDADHESWYLKEWPA